MAKEITISMADSQFESLQEAYAKDDDSVEKVAVEAAAEVLYTDDDDIPEGKSVGDIKIARAEAKGAVDEAYVKNRLMNILKAKVRNYDDAKQEVSYSTFEPS
jgi:hypothetical protein